MKGKVFVFIAVMALAMAAVAGMKDPMVGGHEMFPNKNIIENAMNSSDHTTLVAAVKAAGLVDTLEGAGPFTVFAPTNEAFAKLPAGTVDTLLKPENKATLTKVLTYHVVAGRVSAQDLMKLIKEGGGKAELTTVEGGKLWAMQDGKTITLKDEKGGTATGHDRERVSVKRRHPRDRHGADAELEALTQVHLSPTRGPVAAGPFFI
jgi:uncharacterized surface protein with fasciclin (FAS1) repeats